MNARASYDCMTDDELALWRAGVRRTAGVPCYDCPLWFAQLAHAAGRCCSQGNPPRTPDVRRRGARGPRPTYATETDRLDARRRTWRESKRRARLAS